MEKIKDCPFCGAISDPIDRSKNKIWLKGSNYRYVCCVSCGATGGSSGTWEGAISKWNKRQHEICSVSINGDALAS